MRARRVSAGLAAAGLVVAAVFSLGAVRAGPRTRALPFYQDATLTPHWLSTPRERALAHRVGDFHLVDAAGHAVTGRDVHGRVYVASFF